MVRFNIRELFLITLMIALCLGWWLDHAASSNVKEENMMLQEELQSTLDAFESYTGERFGTGLPNGKYFQSRGNGAGIRKGSG